MTDCRSITSSSPAFLVKAGIAAFTLASILSLVSCNSPNHRNLKSGDDLTVAAYVWPSCHDDSLARKWIWPAGEGEWEVIRQGDPRFPGHYQPKQPLWGYEMDNDPEVVEKWIGTALDYGINTFIYDWYWYKDPDGYNGEFLESALNDGFLKAPSSRKMNFCLMWANHDVRFNYWNCRIWGDRRERLFNPDVTWEDMKVIVHKWVDNYFSQPNYLRFDGKPVLMIFSTDNLVRSFGSMAEVRRVFDYLREETVKAGHPGLYIIQTEGGGSNPDGHEGKLDHIRTLADSLALDAFAFYNMGGFDPDYLRHGENAREIRDQWDELIDLPVFPCASIGWDDSPRYPHKTREHCTAWHSTPESFAVVLREALDYVDAHPEQPRMVTINAWNEWIEGSYLLPDRLNGFGYLEAVKRELDAHARRKAMKTAM